jgi:hypothetical protein
MAKLEAAQSILEQQAEGKLPGKMDSFMVSGPTGAKAKRAKQTARRTAGQPTARKNRAK